jgi:hypothetical protein
MLYTLADARSFVNAFVLTGGACASNAAVLSRINEAQRRLLDKADWEFTEQKMCVITYNNTITLPRQVESARLVAVNHSPRRLFGTNYEFLEHGPGPHNSCYVPFDLEDIGDGFPTMFEIPLDDNYKLFFASSQAPTITGGSVGQVKVRGCTPTGEDVFSGLVPTIKTPGEQININRWAGGVEGTLDRYPGTAPDNTDSATAAGDTSNLYPWISANAFQDIYSVHLPSGRTDYVSLYAVSETTRQMYFLAKYHPDETVPGYRRYLLRGYCPPATQTSSNCAHVQLMVKLRHTPLSRDDDILLIQNLDALKNMVLAIREENAGNVEKGLMYEQKALQILGEQESNKRDGQLPLLTSEDNYGFRNAGQIR